MATNFPLGDLTIGAERAILVYQFMEFWLLADMKQSGSVDFSEVDVDKYALPDLGYLPGRTYLDKSIRCWKYCSKLYIVVSVGGSRYSYFLGRDHMINLIDRLKSFANVRSFKRVFRTTGINDDKPLDISRAVMKVEKYIGNRIHESYPGEDTKIPKSLKQVLAVLENDYHMHEIPDGLDTGEDRRRKKLLEGLEEVCKDANGLVALLKDLGTYDGIVLDLCYLFQYLPTPDRDIITTLKVTREKITEDRTTDPKAVRDFIGFCEIYNLLVTASKEHSIPTYECEPGKENKVRTAVEFAIKHSPGNPPESLWGTARLKKHFPYVHTADKAFVQAKDVTSVPASYDDYINLGSSAFRRNVSSNAAV